MTPVREEDQHLQVSEKKSAMHSATFKVERPARLNMVTDGLEQKVSVPLANFSTENLSPNKSSEVKSPFKFLSTLANVGGGGHPCVQ